MSEDRHDELRDQWESIEESVEPEAPAGERVRGEAEGP